MRGDHDNEASEEGKEKKERRERWKKGREGWLCKMTGNEDGVSREEEKDTRRSRQSPRARVAGRVVRVDRPG